MARKKLSRVVALEKARTRLAAIKSIDNTLDLGSGVNARSYEDHINALNADLEAYNTALSTVDNLYNNCIAKIDAIKDWNERILAGVATKYGKNSSQYEMAGGVKKSDRKKPTQKRMNT
ncbi:hypothetical protein [Flavobacterium sp. GCM10027622]|uniref:hypothetical protein n=1 Tax=unclassified Flavobacterium TaxID=196869 RepID=UPI00361103C6